jgi:hypothetical protein
VNRRPSARSTPRAALLGAALLALSTAPPAAAQQREAGGRAAAPRSARVDVPLPPPPEGARLERRGGTLGVAVGPWAGFGTGSSFAAHLDYGFPRTPAGWGRLELEVRLAVMASHPSKDTTITRTVLPPAGQLDVGVEKARVWLFEAVPTARLRLHISPTFALFADAGLGLAQTLERYDTEATFVGHTARTKNVTGLVLRAGGGASLDVGERWRVLFVPVALSFQLGPRYGGYAPSLGVAYRM